MSAASGPAPFFVEVEPNRGEVVLVPAGELDLASAGRLEDEVRGLRDAGFDRFVLDLRRLTFLDSTGLRVLLAMRNTARRLDHRLELVAGAPQVQRIFELTATRTLFDWRDRIQPG